MTSWSRIACGWRNQCIIIQASLNCCGGTSRTKILQDRIVQTREMVDSEYSGIMAVSANISKRYVVIMLSGNKTIEFVPRWN